MNKRTIISIAVALVLFVVAAAPVAAHGNGSDGDASAGISAPQEPATDESAEPQKRGGSRLARVLSAPFRALARLFRGGGRGAEVAKKSARPAGVKAEVAVGQAAEKREREEAPPPPASVEPAGEVAAAKPAGEGARVVRPGAPAAAAPKKGLWVPVIAGVPPDSLSQGRALFQHGYLNEAISELSVAAIVGPNLVEANNLLGLAYDRRGWHRMAAECYERALSVAPKDPVVLSNLGYSLYLDDNYAAALKRLKQAARLSPATPVIHNNVGIVQARLGKFDDAFKSFARAGGEYDAHLKLAGILETARRDKDAIRHYEAALRLQPDTTNVLERLAVLYDRTGRKGDAETARRALAQPKNPQRTATGGGG